VDNRRIIECGFQIDQTASVFCTANQRYKKPKQFGQFGTHTAQSRDRQTVDRQTDVQLDVSWVVTQRHLHWARATHAIYPRSFRDDGADVAEHINIDMHVCCLSAVNHNTIHWPSLSLSLSNSVQSVRRSMCDLHTDYNDLLAEAVTESIACIRARPGLTVWGGHINQPDMHLVLQQPSFVYA